MIEQNLSYLVFELTGLGASFLALSSLGKIRTLFTRRFLVTLAGLQVTWMTWDLLAIQQGVFLFPSAGTLPVRILEIPLEEHLFFAFHSIAIWTVIEVAEAAKPILGEQQE